MDNKLLKYVIILLLILFGVSYVTSQLAKTVEEKKPVAIEETKKKAPVDERVLAFRNRRKKVLPEDPAKYGIVTIDKNEAPTTQVEWNLYMKKVFKDSGILEKESSKPSIEKMKTTPERFQEDMSRLDKRIELFEKNEHEFPIDEERSQKQLQSMYLLKSVGEILRNKVVDPNAAPPPRMNQTIK